MAIDRACLFAETKITRLHSIQHTLRPLNKSWPQKNRRLSHSFDDMLSLAVSEWTYVVTSAWLACHVCTIVLCRGCMTSSYLYPAKKVLAQNPRLSNSSDDGRRHRGLPPIHVNWRQLLRPAFKGLSEFVK